MPVTKKNIDNLQLLIDNGVSLQKVTLSLVESTKMLSERIDKLVGLFEEATKQITSGSEEDKIKELGLKIEGLVQQNKDIARGLVLLEDYVRGSGSISPKGPNLGSF